MNAEQLVAHRGYQAEYPENTLIGVEAALDAGARWVEIDVQLSADGVPVVIHDPDLARTSDSSAVIAQHPWHELREIEVSEPSRFGDEFAGSGFTGNQLPRLRDVLRLVARYPPAEVFVEVKKHCLRHRNAEQVAARVLADYDDDSTACPIISFEPSILLAVRATSELPIGLVLSAYDQAHHDWLKLHQPEWVFCNHRLAETPLWSDGNWRWVMYPVNEAAAAKTWLRQGAGLIETDDIGALLSHTD